MASNRRVNQVADTLWKALAVLMKRSLSDPRLQTVTVTGVDVSSDLRHARIFVAMRDVDNRDSMMKALQKAGPYLRTMLSKQTALRVVPVLHFYFDESIDRAVKLTNLIDRLVEGDEKPDHAEEKKEQT